MYLVDTNILSASAATEAQSAPEITAWMEQNSRFLYLSTITVAEVEDGIAKMLRDGASRKAGRLTEWLDTILALYGDRILPLDIIVARALGRLSDRARAQGRQPGFADLGIAATASVWGYTILTRNIRHFAEMGVPVRDPFQSQS